MLNINLIDTTFAHCIYSNNPMPPVQFSDNITWIKEITDYSSTVFITDANTQLDLSHFNGKKIAWLLECREYQSNLYQWIKTNHNKFDYVLTHDYELSNDIPNSLWVPFGGCWVDKKHWSLNHDKQKLLSIVASSKNSMSGHKLRHQIINEFREVIDLYGNGYNPIVDKIDSLRNYKYQIVIENAKIDGYFTEKLMDCFVTGTVPIYLGNSRISDVFNSNGIIQVRDYDELRNVITNLDNYDYESFKEAVEDNYNRSMEYILTEDYIYKNYINKLL